MPFLQHFFDGKVAHEYDIEIPARLIHGIRRLEVIIGSSYPVLNDIIHELTLKRFSFRLTLRKANTDVNDLIRDGNRGMAELPMVLFSAFTGDLVEQSFEVIYIINPCITPHLPLAATVDQPGPQRQTGYNLFKLL